MRTKPIVQVMRNRALSALAGTAPVSQEYAALPEADTHCFDDDTRTSVWSYSAEQMRAFADATYALRASPAPAQPGQEPVVNRATVVEWLDALDIEVTDKQMDGLFHAAALASDPAQPAGMTDDEKHLRRMLCVAHAGALAYMDDGEASDSRMHPTIDFLRDSPKDIQRKIWERNRAAFTAAPAQPVAQQAMAYASLPDMDDTLWLAIGQHRRAITTVETSAAAKAVDAAVRKLLRDYADATHTLRVESLAAAYCEELDKLSQRNYELRLASHGQAPAGDSLRTDALCDLSYSHGLKAGWNYCASDDLAGFERAQKIGTEALRTLKSTTAQAAPAAVAGPVAFTAEHVTYIRRYGGSCRDCADENGFCPNRGLPCADSEKAIRFVLEALAYGINHGYIAAPTTQPAPQQEPDEIRSYTAARAWVVRAAQEGKP